MVRGSAWVAVRAVVVGLFLNIGTAARSEPGAHLGALEGDGTLSAKWYDDSGDFGDGSGTETPLPDPTTEPDEYDDEYDDEYEELEPMEMSVELAQVGKVKRKITRLRAEAYWVDEYDEEWPIEEAAVSVTCSRRRTKVTRRGVTDADGVLVLRFKGAIKGMTCRAEAAVDDQTEESEEVRLR